MEKKLIICSEGCVNPILIYSIENKIDIYITGEIVRSARLISKEYIGDSKKHYFFHFEGGLYFYYKDSESQKIAINKIKKIFNIHEENLKAIREWGKEIPSPETDDSYFWGSLVGPAYRWASLDGSPQMEEIDKFRFLTMRITTQFPISREELTYDTGKSILRIDRRCFHSGEPLKIDSYGTPFIGLVDPRTSMHISKGTGAFLLNLTPDQYDLSREDTPKDILIFKDIIKSIASQIFKIRDTLEVY